MVVEEERYYWVKLVSLVMLSYTIILYFSKKFIPQVLSYNEYPGTSNFLEKGTFYR